MNILLFFVFPIATIIFAIAIEKILKNPLLTAAIIFAIFLITTFTAFDDTFLIYAIIYSILAFIVAIITEFILQFKCKKCCQLGKTNNTEDTLSLSDDEISKIANEIANIQNNTCNCSNNTNINNTTREINRCYYRR